MRSIVVLLAVVALCAIGPPSWAYYNPFEGYGGWPVSFDLENYDVGTQYFNLADGVYTKAQLDALPVLASYDPSYDPDNDGDLDPYKVLPPGGASGEDTWGIFRVLGIYATDGAFNLPEDPFWTPSNSGYEITAIFWGEDDQGLIVSNSGQSQKIWGNNMYAAFFVDDTREFASAWQNGPGYRGTASGGNAGDPVYAGVTDSEWGGADATNTSSRAIWTFKTVYGTDLSGEDPNNPGSYLYTGWDKAEFVNDFSPASPPTKTTINGQGGAYAVAADVPYWGTGYGNWMWQDNPSYFGDTVHPHTVEIQFTANGKMDGTQPGNGWLVSSKDPLTGAVTPELSSASLMLVGLLPIGLIGWRRRKK